MKGKTGEKKGREEREETGPEGDGGESVQFQEERDKKNNREEESN